MGSSHETSRDGGAGPHQPTIFAMVPYIGASLSNTFALLSTTTTQQFLWHPKKFGAWKVARAFY